MSKCKQSAKIGTGSCPRNFLSFLRSLHLHMQASLDLGRRNRSLSNFAIQTFSVRAFPGSIDPSLNILAKETGLHQAGRVLPYLKKPFPAASGHQAGQPDQACCLPLHPFLSSPIEDNATTERSCSLKGEFISQFALNLYLCTAVDQMDFMENITILLTLALAIATSNGSLSSCDVDSCPRDQSFVTHFLKTCWHSLTHSDNIVSAFHFHFSSHSSLISLSLTKSMPKPKRGS